MIIKTNVNIKKGVINKAYLPYLNSQKRTQIFYGGSSSGKSFYVAQRTVIDICNGGRNYLCVRNVKNTIKKSMFNEIVKAIYRMNMKKLFKINHSDLEITCVNDYQILFAGLDDVEKIKSITPKKGVLTDIWIEEATEVLENDVRQLNRRLRGKSKKRKRLTMTFNPIMKSSWIYTTYFKNWDDDSNHYEDMHLSILKTTYKDNLRFLEDEDIYLLENETDKYYYEVYTLGNWGVLGNLIFKNWIVKDLHAEMVETKNGMVPLISTFDNFKNGLDFGFSSDPAALSHTHYDKKKSTIYYVDEIYERELTNDKLGAMVKEMIGKQYVICDSSEPKSIRELQVMGINALGAKKGKDSVNFGIDWLQRQTIIIDIRCQNTKNEYMQYKWKEDKDGNVLKVPVDKFNHIIDGTRYGYEDEMTYGRVKAVAGF